MSRKQIFLYMQNWLPETNGDGTSCGIYSDARAYHDLGYQVEVVSFQTRPPLTAATDPALDHLRITTIPAAPPQTESLLSRLAYRAGWPLWEGSRYRFKQAAQIRAAVLARHAQSPGALHQFEYLDTACVLTGLPELKSIWRLHDIETQFLQEHHHIRQELENRAPSASERHAVRFMQHVERKLAQKSALVLCYARHEQQTLREDWGCARAELLPVSWPDESPVLRRRGWVADGELRLLHIGRIDSLPSYRSLEFILKQVFPLLSEAELARTSLLVIGKINDTQRAQALKRLAQPYPLVRFLDYQEQLPPWYAGADLQLVGSTHATGLRTRIIQSWAWGVPVLSTTPGAQGLTGLQPGDNILLADSPEDFAGQIRRVLTSPDTLARLAASARATYQQTYSRAVVAKTLDSILNQYFA